MKAPNRRSDIILLLVASVCGVFFVLSLGRLWPLVPGNLHAPPERLRSNARAFLEKQGVSVAGYVSVTDLNVDEVVLDYLERRFDQEQTRSFIAAGKPVVSYEVRWKKRGTPEGIVVQMLPSGRVIGWRQDIAEDTPGRSLATADARLIAQAALALVAPDTLPWREISASERAQTARVDHSFGFERTVSVAPELRERALVRVAGDRVTLATRTLVVPTRENRAAHAREAPRTLLLLIGTIFFGTAVLGAFVVFLLRLRDGSARLRRAAVWSGLVFVCTVVATLLQFNDVFDSWDSQWPPFVSFLQQVVNIAQNNLWTVVVLMAVVAAGDALDTELQAGRGESLWRLTRGRLFDPIVGAASGRGFLLGLICGGVMAASVFLLTTFFGGRVALQPRGFMFFALDSPAPGLCTLLYFLHVALLEELGYRYFAGSWLLKMTRRPALAVILPALVYGLTHTDLSFLPPTEPFWGRALTMTLVGCVWGVAFLRYDALTVFTSHLSADLFILNWPRLASGDPMTTASAAATVLVPLIPALGLLGHLASRKNNSQPSIKGDSQASPLI